MLRSMKAKHVRMVIAGLSLIVSIIILGTIPTWVESQKCWEICVWNHVCLLQILGGVFLFVGSLKNNYWLFLPWLVSSCIFIYTLLYKSVLYWYHLEGRILMVVPLLQTIAGFWCYFVDDVFQDFLLWHGQGHHINLSN
ncbi:uncharacterized protein [Drosophila kikkawai]|uniref:Uncharacterized protein n=1 Tax=Drosophila kikkawai TaxID=30033 RepID=A0A6P4I6C5_DROKI|nr:uncharacterized protein LOC108076234 [Drosophila kikkawai]XP_017024468.1 uncharacterized protein LOC108076234 [Drosophila kikkawai]